MSPTSNAVRTDEDIKSAVVSQLRWDASVDASKVEVTVDGGRVTLRGVVPSYPALTDATLDTFAVEGVTVLRRH